MRGLSYSQLCCDPWLEGQWLVQVEAGRGNSSFDAARVRPGRTIRLSGFELLHKVGTDTISIQTTIRERNNRGKLKQQTRFNLLSRISTTDEDLRPIFSLHVHRMLLHLIFCSLPADVGYLQPDGALLRHDPLTNTGGLIQFDSLTLSHSFASSRSIFPRYTAETDGECCQAP